MPDVTSSPLVTVVTSTSIAPRFQRTSVAATAVLESTMVSSSSSSMVESSQSPAAPGGEVPASQVSEAIIGVVVVVLVAIVVGGVVVAATLIVWRVKSGVKTYTGVHCLFYITITYVYVCIYDSTDVEFNV